ncbi:MAG: MFS transporter [Kiloniellales bacterium]|nr:MFS transporter [Kiloniellales bacterium]
MLVAILPIGALLTSVALLLMGNGLQGVLLPVRALAEDFSSFEVGILGASYYLGYGAGCVLGPFAVRRVGHIRTFAAFVSIAASLVLIHGLFTTPSIWWLARAGTGFSLASLYLVIESWLNERSTQENRGAIFSVYTIVNLTVVTLGQMMLPLASPQEFSLFALAAVLVCLSAIPVCMSVAAAPTPPSAVHIRLRHLYRLSPVGVVGAFSVGLANGAFWSLGPIFAQRDAADTAAVAIFMSIAVLAGALGQWPFGKLSDRMDRRRVIIAASVGAALAAISLVFTARHWEPGILIAVGLFGICALPVYAICAAHLNDQVESDGYVEASSGLNLLFAAGAVAGPILASVTMRYQGVEGLFLYTAVIHAILAAFAAYRMKRKVIRIVEERADFLETLVQCRTVAEIDTRTETDDEDSPKQEGS